MVYGDLQFFDIIIFAAIAVFLIYRLRSVLGKRAGFQKTKSVKTEQIKNSNKTKDKTPQLKDSEEKLSIVYEKVENFDHKNFLDGA